MSERRELEAQLSQSQKLEAIGQLAAGVAHEINSPFQFIGDNTRFVQTALSRVVEALDAYRAAASHAPEAEQAALQRLERRLKLDFVLANIGEAVGSSISGIGRVAEIVAALKEFSHPGLEAAPSNLNDAVRCTTRVCANTYKHIATVDLRLDEHLPEVVCTVAEINQLLVNILVNTAQALEECYGHQGRGAITISTHHDDAWVEVRVADNGPGMPEKVRERIFDPFFTTKEVGKGTGQGLAISRRIVVEGHGGQLSCDSVVGEGMVFRLRLPRHIADDAGRPLLAAGPALTASGRRAEVRT